MQGKRVLVTGSSGLIGSEAVEHFDRQGHRVIGTDNNMRRVFFGPPGDTTWNLERLKTTSRDFHPYDIDIRDRAKMFDLFKEHRFDLIIHCAAQPSHDKAKEIPFVDFEVNALGTLNLLEATRQYCREAVFILMSTNKVYGDAPNERPLQELPTRYDFARAEDFEGIDERAQEYGRYFGMNVGVFRGGCLTGPQHSGVELHGFLSYFVKVALTGQTYRVFGYKGKQVRDNIHSYDVVRAMEEFAANPRPGELYNLGGGRENSISILEAIARVEEMTGRKIRWVYQEEARKGDHICYISDLRKFRSHYPNWGITRSLDAIIKEMVESSTSPQLSTTASA
jgi:CDP-paratose 2-epimerase